MRSPRRIGIAVHVHLLYKHHSEVFAGLQRYADERGWLTTIDDWIWDTLAESPRGRPAYDGVIARVTQDALDLVDATSKAGIPLVNVIRSSPAFDRLPGVFPDLVQSGRIRAEHLLSRGLRHFACISIAKRPSEEAQTRGFADAIAAARCSLTRLDLDEDWGETLPLYRQNQATIHRWMDGWKLPIGMASPVDMYARFIAQRCHDRGWRIPEDVAIVGGMNEEKLCERPRPQLSSVEMGYERVGYEAARLLDSLMDEAEAARKLGKPARLGRRSESLPADPIHVLLPPVGVVVRESSDLFAVDDELVAAAQAFITKQCHMPLTVGDVAEKLCVSVRTLQSRFATALKRSVVQEICRVRIEKVKRELTFTDASVYAIAERAGFTSHKRLCDVFKREVGVSPTEYRDARKPAKTR